MGPVVGEVVDQWELVASDETLGEFASDNNEELDLALSRFILEVRDVLIPPSERRFLPNKRWKVYDEPGVHRAAGVGWCARKTKAKSCYPYFKIGGCTQACN